MIRFVGTVLAGLLGLAFGSFLNVCLSRWPEGESVVKPRSHCRSCGRPLAWWENVPVVSWLGLGGRCRTCRAGISWRYPLIEVTVGVLWAYMFWRGSMEALGDAYATDLIVRSWILLGLNLVLGWLLIALAYLDVEHLWLPDWLTYPGVVIGLLYSSAQGCLQPMSDFHQQFSWLNALTSAGIGLLWAIEAALLVLVIRWTYWLIRRREGIGFGDAKLMAMLGAWLGLSGALLSFAIGVMLAAIYAVNLLATPAARRGSDAWAASKLPLGSFLCLGGIISALWGNTIIRAYLHYAGF